MKKTKKRELKDIYKLVFNTIILLSNCYVINTMFKAVKMYGALDGIYSMRYMLLIAIMMLCSTQVLKRINYSK